MAYDFRVLLAVPLGHQLDANAAHDDEHLQPMYNQYLDEAAAKKWEQEHVHLEHAYAEIKAVADRVTNSTNRYAVWHAL